MKTNIFRVKERKNEKIVIEEERTKNPFILFFLRHKNLFMMLLITILICSFLISVGIAFSLFRGTNDYDITYISGSDKIDSNSDSELNDEDVKEELLGEVAREDGVVVLVETFMSNQGDIVSYYTDGTSVIVQANGNIFRVSPLKNGNYGVDRNGKIYDSAKKIAVSSTTSTLADGTVITYYSDGTARIEYNQEVIFARDSNNIVINNGTNFSFVNPSGVALSKNTEKVASGRVVTFSDGTVLVYQGNKKFLVNKNVGVTVGDDVSYDSNNTFGIIGEKTLDDGNVITQYSNGAAVITQKDGNVIYVKKSGDIVVKKQKLYEIITNEYGYSKTVVNCPNGRKVIYFDNGAAIIILPDGTRQYVADNTEIIYDGFKNISSLPNVANQISQRTTADGDQVFNFNNGKSQVVKSDGTSYIVDTNKLIFFSDGNIVGTPDDLEGNSPPKPEKDYDPAAGLYVSEAENRYNNAKNIEDTVFIIRNDNTSSRTLRITIVEVENYKKYNTARLDPRYVRFQATIGDDYITARNLTSNIWRNSSNKVNYVIYDGVIPAKTTETVAISLYVDYAELTNRYQNTGFIGTINIYVDGKQANK